MHDVLNQEEIDFILDVCSEKTEENYKAAKFSSEMVKLGLVLAILLFFIKSVFS